MDPTTLQTKQPLKHQNIGDDRAAPRFDASAIPGFKSIIQVGGPKVKLINISRRGLLIEGREFMSPGSSISLQLFTAEAVYPIKGRITRCRSTSMDDKGLQYQSAIFLDEDLTIL